MNAEYNFDASPTSSGQSDGDHKIDDIHGIVENIVKSWIIVIMKERQIDITVKFFI